jgi:hypothetical protein
MSNSQGYNRKKRITKALDAVYIGEPKTPIYANVLSYLLTHMLSQMYSQLLTNMLSNMLTHMLSNMGI